MQTADSADDEATAVHSIVADYLNRNFGGVNASESADNPFQLDIYYHGFTASALLGTPEGLSVYVDGVRVNEAFGDTVNWDLIPQSAISTVTLMSGSNPVFGLNTLGGALSVQTKSGHDDPGTEFEAYGGSFGRRSLRRPKPAARAATSTTSSTGNYFDETGWRDISPITVVPGVRQDRLADREDRHRSQLHLRRHQPVRQRRRAARACSRTAASRATRPTSPHNLLHFVNLTGYAVPVRARCCCPATPTTAV